MPDLTVTVAEQAVALAPDNAGLVRSAGMGDLPNGLEALDSASTVTWGHENEEEEHDHDSHCRPQHVPHHGHHLASYPSGVRAG